MKRRHILVAFAVVAPLLAAEAAGAQTGPARGQVLMTVHTHTAGTLLFPADRLSYSFTQGEQFAYSSRLCSGNAPFNDLGLNFIPDYPGVDSDADHTAAVRHGFSGRITGAYGARGTLEGKLITVLCRPGPNGRQVESPNAIVSYIRASYLRASDNVLQINGSFQFSPTESTGTFRDLTGGGYIEGRFVCLVHQGNPAQPSCAQLGEYTDFVSSTGDPNLPAGQLQPGMRGSYYDPTVGPIL